MNLSLDFGNDFLNHTFELCEDAEHLFQEWRGVAADLFVHARQVLESGSPSSPIFHDNASWLFAKVDISDPFGAYFAYEQHRNFWGAELTFEETLKEFVKHEIIGPKLLEYAKFHSL